MTRRGHAMATARRARTPDASASLCAWCFDGTPSERRAGKGLSPRMCRHHREHLARHGHAAKPSWRADEVRPFIRVAERCIRATFLSKPVGVLPSDRAVRATVNAYRCMIDRSGPPVRNLPRSPGERSRALLGRLRSKYLESVEGGARRATVQRIGADALAIKVAAVVVGLELAHAFDPAPADSYFLEVQIGKAVHRLAGGHHRVFAFPSVDIGRAGTLIVEVNKYDPSRGNGLAHLGRMLREKDLIIEDHRAALVTLIEDSNAANRIANWTDARAMRARVKKGGRRRPPYKRLEEQGHDRVRLTSAVRVDRT